ncbi:hypothetical protein GCM10020227_58080 [Streptomyces flavovirens]
MPLSAEAPVAKGSAGRGSDLDLAGGGVGVLAAQGEEGAAQEADGDTQGEQRPVAQELAELVTQEGRFVLLLQGADRMRHRRAPPCAWPGASGRVSPSASASRASKRARPASRLRWRAT